MSIFLWYLFSAGITKEVLQGVFYLAIYFFCIKNRLIKSKLVKVLLGAGILALSAFSFREYYILTAFFSVIVYLIFSLIRGTFLKKYNSFALSVLFFLAVLALFLVAAQVIFPREFDMIVGLRSIQYSYLADDTDSFIGDVIDNSGGSIALYIANYCLTFARLLFPVELLVLAKPHYFPFLLCQIMFSCFWLAAMKNLKALDDEKFMSLVFITSFLIVSAMMEPDFGSWARHQSVCWMIMLSLLNRRFDK